MRVVKYSTHLWAIQKVSTGALVKAYDEYTGKDEVVVFSSHLQARFWGAEQGFEMVR
ncbi:MAG TPA: hypothetical protein VN039_14980 [Nitrospira sp.]|nr:hypothetical protein [Nitrospira sp.]